jgi:hypothetical protein
VIAMRDPPSGHSPRQFAQLLVCRSSGQAPLWPSHPHLSARSAGWLIPLSRGPLVVHCLGTLELNWPVRKRTRYRSILTAHSSWR